MSTTGVQRIGIVNTHPIQYFAPFYAYLSTQQDIDVEVLYLSDSSLRGAKDEGFGQHVAWDIDLLAGYRSAFVGSHYKTVAPRGFLSLATPAVWKIIRQRRYDAIIVHGYSIAANLIAIAAAKSVGTSILMRTDTHLLLKRTRGAFAHQRNLRKAVFAGCDGLLAVGTLNAIYYRSLGVPDGKISLVPFSVDNARFTAASSMSDEERRAERALLGVTDDLPIVLYLSKLQRRKHPDDLLRAAGVMAREGLRFHVVIAGSGEMETELRTLASESAASVHFAGFINQSRMPRVLAACDVFVLPSEEEPWALVVNEAMCAGLPVIVGSDVGCVPDLVKPGVNGDVVTPGRPDELSQCLRPLVADHDLRRRMGQASREIIDGWSYRECLAGLREALAKTSRNNASAPR